MTAEARDRLAEQLREFADRTTGYIYADEMVVLQEAAALMDSLAHELAEQKQETVRQAHRFMAAHDEAEKAAEELVRARNEHWTASARPIEPPDYRTPVIGRELDALREEACAAEKLMRIAFENAANEADALRAERDNLRKRLKRILAQFNGHLSWCKGGAVCDSRLCAEARVLAALDKVNE